MTLATIVYEYATCNKANNKNNADGNYAIAARAVISDCVIIINTDYSFEYNIL